MEAVLRGPWGWPGFLVACSKGSAARGSPVMGQCTGELLQG